ncbi:MAG TPA: hypothetical protein VF705_14750 [Longimicrobium sp.]
MSQSGNAGADGAGPAHASQPGPRKEVGTAADSQRHPPHVDVNADDAPVQDSTESPTDVPVLPANAGGTDHGGTTTGTPDDESMYGGRPGEDKDRKLTDMP